MANGDGSQSATPPPAGWMSDVQRALALLLIGSVTFMIIMLTLRIMWSGDLPTISALLKELKDALVNMSLIALGFFFGNTMAKMAADAGQQKVVDKLTSTAPGTLPPPPPIAAPTVVVAWWSKLTDAERAAITVAAPNDPKAASFMAAAQTGVATPDDLADLVAKGLLTQDRADAVKA